MRRRSAPDVGWLVTVLAVAAVAGFVVAFLAGEGGPLPRRTETVIDTEVRQVVVPPEGQAVIRGRATTLTAARGVGAPLPMPLVVDTGGATITGAIVDGVASTIEWDGGRPLQLDGDGALDLSPTLVRVAGGTATWALGGVHGLLPGTYRVVTPVAVGTTGLAEPRDRVSFTATAETTIEVRGPADADRPFTTLHLEGPGELHGTGTFSITTDDGVETVDAFSFGPGPYVVDILADGTFTATVRGALS